MLGTRKNEKGLFWGQPTSQTSLCLQRLWGELFHPSCEAKLEEVGRCTRPLTGVRGLGEVCGLSEEFCPSMLVAGWEHILLSALESHNCGNRSPFPEHPGQSSHALHTHCLGFL